MAVGLKRNRAGGGHRIETVASRAGVSVITVSRTLNKPETVAASTRAKVLRAIESLGYVPNRLAGGLASSRSRSIGVVLPSITNPAYAERIRGMTDALSPAGFDLLLGLSEHSPEKESRHVAAFLGERVAGLALTGTMHAARTVSLLAKAGIPVVEIPILSDDRIDMAVGYAIEGACRAMVSHLVLCGYRRIGLVTLPATDNQLIAARQSGFRSAVLELGLDTDPRLIVEAASGPAGSARAFAELIKRRPDVEAVFCTSDIQAIGCILEATRRGIRVPDDIGVAGYDDIELAQEFVPALTTVRFDRYRMGRVAAEMLLARIRGESSGPDVVDVGFEVIPRGSTRRVPSIGQSGGRQAAALRLASTPSSQSGSMSGTDASSRAV